MNRIHVITAREILDSRGFPTVEVDVGLENGAFGRMMVPSGASTGSSEALELRDGDASRYRGKGVRQAVDNVNRVLAKALAGMDAEDQEAIDRAMIDLDGTANKSALGANAILGVSMACAHAAASAAGKPLFRYLADRYLPAGAALSIPMPMVNIISGGKHAGQNIDFQDFLVMPVGASDYPQALEMVSSVYFAMKDLLASRGYVSSLVADEGGFGPQLNAHEEALELLCDAMEAAGLTPGKQMAIALDAAASHFYDQDANRYELQSEQRQLTSDEMIEMLEGWARRYPIVSIEDGLAEEDWRGWQKLTSRLGSNVRLVGDDLFATNPARIARGIKERAGNAVLVKMNQIGTLTETVEAIRLAESASLRTVISARSGETEDCTLADLAVGTGGDQIKIGSVNGSSRLAKYNQLLRIHEQIGGSFRICKQ